MATCGILGQALGSAVSQAVSENVKIENINIENPSTPKLDTFQSAAFVTGHLSQMSLRGARIKMTCSIQLSDATGSQKVLFNTADYMQALGCLLPWVMVNRVGFLGPE